MPTKAQPSGVLGVNPLDRVQVFIDAAHLMGMLRRMNMKLDYKIFMKFLKEETRLIRAHYYVLLREDMEETAMKVIDLIEYAGFDVYRKWGREVQEGAGHYRFRGSVVPEMTVGMIDAAENDADHIILIGGDGELYAGMEAVKARGARFTVVGRQDSLSNDLRRGCDAFVDIATLPKDIFQG
jgi:uncharacterized LabA/DUF88 family protein